MGVERLPRGPDREDMSSIQRVARPSSCAGSFLGRFIPFWLASFYVEASASQENAKTEELLFFATGHKPV